jgi:hypothetical protein
LKLQELKMPEPEQRAKRHAVLYFSPKNSDAFKELAARVRSDGGRTTLVWSNRWKGAESILTECRAIIIEKDCANATAIQEAYRRYAVDCEIHFADADGEFAEADAGFIEPDDTTDQNADGSVDDDEGATSEESDTDPDAASDAVVQAEAEAGDDPVDPVSDGEDDGPSEDSGEAGEESASDSERTSSD